MPNGAVKRNARLRGEVANQYTTNGELANLRIMVVDNLTTELLGRNVMRGRCQR